MTNESFANNQGMFRPPNEEYDTSGDHFYVDQPDEAKEIPDIPDLTDERLDDRPEASDSEPPAPDTIGQDDHPGEEKKASPPETSKEDGIPPGGQPPAPPGTPPQPSGEEPQGEDEIIRQNLATIEQLNEIADRLLIAFTEIAILSEAMEDLMHRRFEDIAELENATLQAIQRAQSRRPLEDKELELLGAVGQPIGDPEALEEPEHPASEPATWVEQIWPDVEGVDVTELPPPTPLPGPGQSLRSLSDLSEDRAEMQHIAAALAADWAANREAMQAFEQDVAFLRTVDPETAEQLASEVAKAGLRLALRGIDIDTRQDLIRKYFDTLENPDRQNIAVQSGDYWKKENWK